ncbi:hypothetical protein XELAEV_18029158mg [Xenopus laevis]|uniref:Uncharacterized protein n=1 Tax=Xenopus laevis TaxID=8355 RepID=A0A974CSV4_XENLA|nr:hypothetical protein XELAEV_18029158mg [Xenopus laevis]
MEGGARALRRSWRGLRGRKVRRASLPMACWTTPPHRYPRTFPLVPSRCTFLEGHQRGPFSGSPPGCQAPNVPRHQCTVPGYAEWLSPCLEWRAFPESLPGGQAPVHCSRVCRVAFPLVPSG